MSDEQYDREKALKERERRLKGMEEQLEMVKLDPEASSVQMAALGIEIDAAVIPDMTVKDFAIVVFS